MSAASFSETETSDQPSEELDRPVVSVFTECTPDPADVFVNLVMKVDIHEKNSKAQLARVNVKDKKKEGSIFCLRLNHERMIALEIAQELSGASAMLRKCVSVSVATADLPISLSIKQQKLSHEGHALAVTAKWPVGLDASLGWVTPCTKGERRVFTVNAVVALTDGIQEYIRLDVQCPTKVYGTRTEMQPARATVNPNRDVSCRFTVLAAASPFTGIAVHRLWLNSAGAPVSLDMARVRASIPIKSVRHKRSFSDGSMPASPPSLPDSPASRDPLTTTTATTTTTTATTTTAAGGNGGGDTGTDESTINTSESAPVSARGLGFEPLSKNTNTEEGGPLVGLKDGRPASLSAASSSRAAKRRSKLLDADCYDDGSDSSEIASLGTDYSSSGDLASVSHDSNTPSIRYPYLAGERLEGGVGSPGSNRRHTQSGTQSARLACERPRVHSTSGLSLPALHVSSDMSDVSERSGEQTPQSTERLLS